MTRTAVRRAGAAPLRPDGERGSGTVLALGLVGVVLLLGVALAGLGQAQTARTQAQAAADLAALAGASAVRVGEDGCVPARDVADRNGGTLDACTDEGRGVVAVTTHVDVPVLARLTGAGDGRATARARAGPASARGG